MVRGDLVVDVDALFVALSFQESHASLPDLLPFVASARDAVIDRLVRPSGVGQAWIITTDRTAARALVRRFGAELIELEVSDEQRLARLQNRGRVGLVPTELPL
jgi:hypothetical protein